MLCAEWIAEGSWQSLGVQLGFQILSVDEKHETSSLEQTEKRETPKDWCIPIYPSLARVPGVSEWDPIALNLKLGTGVEVDLEARELSGTM